MRSYWVYILASNKNGTLYTGVTGHLERRIYEHKTGALQGFTSRYNIIRLVHVEYYSDAASAIAREKCIKKWNRAWKIKLIEGQNPKWDDLYEHIL